MKVKLRNVGGVVKEVKVGFSWTTFFFVFLPALFRGDLKWASIMIIIQIVIAYITSGFGVGIVGIVFAFIYNKIYIKELIEKGYVPANDSDNAILEQKRIISMSV